MKQTVASIYFFFFPFSLVEKRMDLFLEIIEDARICENSIHL